MLRVRTRQSWRIAFWTIAILDAALLSFAIAAGDGGGIGVYGVSTVLFLLLAVQSRSAVEFTDEAIVDRRAFLRRRWPWHDVTRVVVRQDSWIRAPLTVVGPRGSAPLQLNPRLLRADRDGLNVPFGDIVDAVVSIAEAAGAQVEDHR